MKIFPGCTETYPRRTQVTLALAMVGASLLPGASPAVAASGGKPVYEFLGGAAGEHPIGRLFIDANGAIYGATSGGPGLNGHPKFLGTVFKLTPPVTPSVRWTESALFTFQNHTQGAYPSGGVVMDANGALYGMTASPRSPENVVYKLTAPTGGGTWTQQIIFRYNIGFVGEPLWYGGNLLLTKFAAIIALQPPSNGGTKWTVDQISPNGFLQYPITSGLAIDRKGGFYAEASANGETPGFIFYAPPVAGGITQWGNGYFFQGGTTDGAWPSGGLIVGSDGLLYGTTKQGGLYGGGTIFQLTPPPAGQTSVTETVLYNFGGNGDGTAPLGGVAQAADGTLYGTTSTGSVAANAGGTVFSFTPPAKQGGIWTYKTLYQWPATTAPNVPQNPQTVAIAPNGKLYGTTPVGGVARCYGTTTCGTVFQVIP